jgi:hypothetical protein
MQHCPILWKISCVAGDEGDEGESVLPGGGSEETAHEGELASGELMFAIGASPSAHGSRINPCPQTAPGKTLQLHRRDLQASPPGFPVSRARPRTRKANPANEWNHQDSPDSADSSPFRPESAWLEMNAKPGIQGTSLGSARHGLKNTNLHSIPQRMRIWGKVAGASRSSPLSRRLRPDQEELRRDASATVWSGTLQPPSSRRFSKSLHARQYFQTALLSSRSISRESRVRTFRTSISHQVFNKGSQDKSASISSASKRRWRVFKLRFGKRS